MKTEEINKHANRVVKYWIDLQQSPWSTDTVKFIGLNCFIEGVELYKEKIIESHNKVIIPLGFFERVKLLFTKKIEIHQNVDYDLKLRKAEWKTTYKI